MRLHFFNSAVIANSKMDYYASLFSMEFKKLLVNDKITASCQTNMSPKHYFNLYILEKLTLNNS